MFQQRINISVNLYRDWISYEQGFGQQGFDFWLGNRVLSALTLAREHTLRIEMFLVDGRHVYTEYDRFRLSFKNYTLLVGQYSGNLSNILLYANNSAFSTWDKDNDKVLRQSCARLNRGAWWYGRNCYTADLNNMLKRFGTVKVAMKIKPTKLRSRKGQIYLYKNSNIQSQLLCNVQFHQPSTKRRQFIIVIV